jgi:hypothetical protein
MYLVCQWSDQQTNSSLPVIAFPYYREMSTLQTKSGLPQNMNNQEIEKK